MSKVVLDLEDEWGRRLAEKAASEKRPVDELLRDAVREYLRVPETEGGKAEPDSYHPLRQMIGLATGGPRDASVHHDLRPSDDE